MARTPLLRALRRLARDHAAAEQLGISVDELRARQEEPAYSRAELLKRTGAAGAAIAVAGPAGCADASGPWRVGCADRHRRRRDRGAHRGPHAAGQGYCLDGLRSPPFPGRRPHAFGLDRVPGLLRRRAGRRALRGADRQRAQDDPHARQAFRPARPSTSSAPSPTARMTPTTSPAPTTRRTQADKDFQRGPQGAAGATCHAASYPTTYLITHARRDRARQHERLRLDRVPRARAAIARRSASSSTSPTTSSTAPRRPTSRRSTSSTCSATRPRRATSRVFGASDERFHIAGGNTLLPYAIRDAIVSSQGAARCGRAGGCRRSRRTPTAPSRWASTRRAASSR